MNAPDRPSPGRERVSPMMALIKSHVVPVLRAEGIYLDLSDSIDRTIAMNYIYRISSGNGRNRITNVGTSMN